MDKKNKGQDPSNNTQPLKYNIDMISSCILETAYYNNLPMGLDRVQRLLYYIQARYIIEYGIPLFSEKIIAGKKGPYVRESYRFVKEALYSEEDTDYQEILDNSKWLKERDRNLIEEVLKTFQDMTTSEMTMKIKEEEPYSLARSKAGKIITNKSLKTYFSSDVKNNGRIYGIYDDFEETDIVNQLFLEPRTENLTKDSISEKFFHEIDQSLANSGLVEMDFHSINDVLGYVCDFLIYKEKNVTIDELQAILYFIQKTFLKELNRPCFNEFVYKSKRSVAIGDLPSLYKIEEELIDKQLMQEKEFDFSNIERAHKADIMRIKLLQVKANRYAFEYFDQEELSLMEMVLDKFITLPGFHILNLVQNEDVWQATNIGEIISVKEIYHE